MEPSNNKKLTPSEIVAKINRNISIIVAHYEKTHPEYQYRTDIKKPLETHE